MLRFFLMQRLRKLLNAYMELRMGNRSVAPFRHATPHPQSKNIILHLAYAQGIGARSAAEVAEHKGALAQVLDKVRGS